MSTKNKKELEAENKELKKLVKELKYQIEDLQLQQKNAKIEGESFPNEGFGMFKVDGNYMLAELRFDADSRDAKVVDVKTAGRNNRSYATAHYAAELRLDEIMKKIGEGK